MKPNPLGPMSDKTAYAWLAFLCLAVLASCLGSVVK